MESCRECYPAGIMNTRYKYLRLQYRFKRGIWMEDNVPFDREHWRVYLAQRLYIAFHGLLMKEHWTAAAQLTFNTLMAIIPVFAIVYAIASGFGFGDLIVSELRQTFSSQPQVADALVTLSENYIKYTHTGTVLGISFVFMLYSAISLFNNIEAVFNRIWGSAADRSFARMLVDYTAMLFIVPICMILFSGLSVFFYSLVDLIPGFKMLTPFLKAIIQYLVPLIILTLFFMAAFVYIPNTNVRLKYVWLPSVIAATCILILQGVFVHFQILFTSYNIIYGSLAALPMLMLWLQMSWYIGITCAELAHANQEIGKGNNYRDREESIEARLNECAIVLSLLCQRQRRGAAPATMKDLLNETHINYHSLRLSLDMLSRARLVHADLSKKSDSSDVFILCRDSNAISFGDMTSALLRTPHNSISRKYPWHVRRDVRVKLRKMRREYVQALNTIPLISYAERAE